MKYICITGAGGSIGSEICRKLLKQEQNLLLVDSSEFSLFKIWEELKSTINSSNKKINITPLLINLTDEKSILESFKKYKILKIYHAAAYKHVNLIEKNPISGLTNNIYSTINIANYALQNDIEIVHISTDKAVKPVNFMGASKRLCEKILLAKSKKGLKVKIVRFGNVLNSSGSVIPIFRDQIKKGGPVTVTSKKAERYFMTIPQAVNLVLRVSLNGENSNIYVLDMGKPRKIYDLAKDMVSKAKKSHIKIKIIGLRSGEKETEELTLGKLIKTKMKGIFISEEKIKLDDNFEDDLIKTIKNPKKIEGIFKLT